MAKSILIKQTKGTAQTPANQKTILKSIGLRGIGTSIYRKDTRALRGMLNCVRHFIEASQVESSPTARPKKKVSGSTGVKVN